MNILVVTQTPPAVTGLGAAMRMGNWVQCLARQHRVTLLIVSADPDTTLAALQPQWLRQCAAVHVVNVADAVAPHPAGAMERLLNRQPRMWARWPMRAISDRLPRLAAATFDSTLVFRLRLWPVLQRLRARGVACGRVVLDMDDLESAAQRRQLQALGKRHFGRIGLALEQLDGLRLRAAEQAVLAQVHAATLASPQDLAAIAPRLRGRVSLVPNAVRLPPTPMRATAGETPDGPYTLLFVGALDYLPNEDAVRWLVDEILPALRAQWPAGSFRCWVVGRHPPPWMQRVSDIELFANVPSVDTYYQRSHVLVVPIRMGGGTRIKILEALSWHRCVVSTSVGAEGLDLVHGEHLLVADSATAFVTALDALRRDPTTARRLAQAGHDHVVRHFSLQAVEAAVSRLFAGS